MKRLIIFLIRKRLGLGKYEPFKFVNQKTDAIYWFGEGCVVKELDGILSKSSVSLNWLLDDDCKIRSLMDPVTPDTEL